MTLAWFRTRGRRVAVAWAEDGAVHPVRLRRGEEAFDLMGNPLKSAEIPVGESPIYLVTE